MFPRARSARPLGYLALLAVAAIGLGSSRAVVDEVAPCPQVYQGLSWMWHYIRDVGDVKLNFNPPQHIVWVYNPNHVEYSPAWISPAVAPDGSTWGAEGTYQAVCVREGFGFHTLRPVPYTFSGRVWMISPPPPPDPPCDPPPDDPPMDEIRAPGQLVMANSCGGGGGGGGDTGGGSGGGGGNCTEHWGVIEVSYDGGATWETLWEGWYTECEAEE